jgi:hypothetical protein
MSITPLQGHPIVRMTPAPGRREVHQVPQFTANRLLLEKTPSMMLLWIN